MGKSTTTLQHGRTYIAQHEIDQQTEQLPDRRYQKICGIDCRARALCEVEESQQSVPHKTQRQGYEGTREVWYGPTPTLKTAYHYLYEAANTCGTHTHMNRPSQNSTLYNMERCVEDHTENTRNTA